MTETEALAEAKRRWDADRPTEWRGPGDAHYIGAHVIETITHESGFKPLIRCVVGYREAWPGCCSGFMLQGEGATWEAAFENADRLQLERLIAQTPEVRNYGYLKERTDKAIADAGSAAAALASWKERAR